MQPLKMALTNTTEPILLSDVNIKLLASITKYITFRYIVDTGDGKYVVTLGKFLYL